MKKNILAFSSALLLIILAITSCKKNINDLTEDKVVTYRLPQVKLVGSQFASTPVGSGTYVDSGAYVFDSLTFTNVKLTPSQNSVDLTTPGFYTVTYTYKNSYGYTNSATRFVLVTTVSATKNFSGLYQRNADPTRPANLLKIGTGLYLIDNVGGVILPDQAPAEPAYIGFPNDTTIQIPLQTTPDGNQIQGANGKFSITATDTTMQWQLPVGPFNPTAVRQFFKVH